MMQPGDGQAVPQHASIRINYSLCGHRTREDEVPDRFKQPIQLANGGCHPDIDA